MFQSLLIEIFGSDIILAHELACRFLSLNFCRKFFRWRYTVFLSTYRIFATSCCFLRPWPV